MTNPQLEAIRLIADRIAEKIAAEDGGDLSKRGGVFYTLAGSEAGRFVQHEFDAFCVMVRGITSELIEASSDERNKAGLTALRAVFVIDFFDDDRPPVNWTERGHGSLIRDLLVMRVSDVLSAKYISVTEAAEMKGVSVQAVRDVLQNEARRRAIFPGAYMVGEGKGGIWFIPRSEVEQWTPRKDTRNL